jgi:hypothetical protein
MNKDMIEALNNFKNATLNLNKAWEQYDIDQKCNNELYPFNEDFNRITSKVIDWTIDVKEQLEKS